MKKKNTKTNTDTKTNILVIVESPTKERTIKKFLGDNYIIKSSYGHVRDLPSKELGVDIANGFSPKYVILPKAKKLLPELRPLAEKAKTVFLATDFDREGEAIAWHLCEMLKLGEDKAKRITFHEITQEAIQDAIKHPRKLSGSLIDAQQARRVLDRLVGYKLSPLLWRKIKRGLSAGRVQSVVLRLICEREKEIADFKSQEYWNISAELEKSGYNKFIADLYAKGDKRFDKFAVASKEDGDRILNEITGSQFVVGKVETGRRKRSPHPPFTTATLQQEASKRLHFSVTKTMIVAQQLYEGVELGSDGGAGLITYMRTDSVNVAQSARLEAAEAIVAFYGKEFLPPKPKIYRAKSKLAQEAHEAIRPTSSKRRPETIARFLTPEQHKLYKLIWQRFMASQMADAEYDTLSVDILAREYVFRATGSKVKFAGFTAIYPEEENGDEGKIIPPLATGETLNLVKLNSDQHFTEPPPRYNEASLVKALEQHGIGRPSTYAPTIQTIMNRGYVRILERKFFPTDLGKIVTEQLIRYFPKILEIDFTAKIEEQLDGIAQGKLKWQDTVGEFYTPFASLLQTAETEMQRVKIQPQPTNETCEKCGSPMVIRENRFGKFMACSAFPKCRNTISLDKEGNKIIRPKPEMTDKTCEKCGKPMLKRFGLRGPFLACSGFPKCRNIKKITEATKPPENTNPSP